MKNHCKGNIYSILGDDTMMSSSESVSKEIYKQINTLSLLTQKEIEELYRNDYVSEKGITEQLEGLCDTMNHMYHDLFGSETRLLHQSCHYGITIDEEIKEEIEDVFTKFNAISNSKILLQEEKEILEFINKYQNQTISDELENEFKNYITSIKNRIRDYRKTYEDEAKKMLLATKGIKVKKRVYPTDETRNRIFLGTINLVKIYASIYYQKLGGKVSYDDLFQTASEALLSACHYYIPSTRAKFTTYASRCIDNKIRREYFKKRKKKKRQSIESEKENLMYADMYFNSIINVNQSYGRYYYEHRTTGFLRELNNRIRSYNEMVLNLGNPEKVKITASFKGDSNRCLQGIFNLMLGLIESGKINLIISDMERSMIQLASDYLQLNDDIKTAWTVAQYLKLYQKKLSDIELYIEVEKELRDNNHGNLPSEEEILKVLNRKVKEFNSKIYSYHHSKKTLPSLKSRKSYLKAYEEEFGVCILADSEDISSRQSEKENIKDEYEAILDFYLIELQTLLDFQKSEPGLSVCCVTNEIIESLGDEKVFRFSVVDDNREDSMSINAAIEIIQEKIDQLEDQEKLLKQELKRRKKIVNQALDIYNGEVYEYNRSIIDDYLASRYSQYKKKYTKKDISLIEEEIQILYSDDDRFMEFVQYQNDVNNSSEISLEDTVCCQAFLNDYYQALEELSPIQKEILLKWFDSEGKHSYSAEEIANSLDIKKADVYREKRKAMKILRNNENLRSYNL